MLKTNSFIFEKCAPIIAILIQIMAVYLFFRGHNLPGGGFIAGVCSGISILLLVMARGTSIVDKLFLGDPLNLAAIGLLISLVSGLFATVTGKAYLSHLHYKSSDFPIFGDLYLGTPMLFDLGVYLIVLSVIVKIFVILMQAADSNTTEENR